MGSELLSRFVDIDALFSRPSIVPVQSRIGAIPLERFQHLEQQIRNSPASSEPYVELGQIYIHQERWSDAKRVLETGVQLCPENESLVLLREELLLHQANKSYAQAKSNFTQDPSDDNRYALKQAEINNANERIRVCRDRFGRHPEHKDVLITWAIALRQMSRCDEAVELLLRAASDLELRSRASLQLGMCYQTLKRPLDALSAFRKAALYRLPPPEPKIRQRALELAIDLAEQTLLIDSARFYAQQLLLDCEPAKRKPLEQKLRQLETMEI